MLFPKIWSEGPQVITRHGRPVARVVAVDSPADAAATDDGFLDFLMSVPQSGLGEGLPKMPRRSRHKPMFGDE